MPFQFTAHLFEALFRTAYARTGGATFADIIAFGNTHGTGSEWLDTSEPEYRA